jgi:PLP dependent protein
VRNIAKSLESLKQKIVHAEQRFGRRAGSVKVLAVSKTRTIQDIITAAEHGQHDFGENYVQEAVAKITSLERHNLVWHFIGPVQSNKTQLIATYFDWVHSVDRIKIVKRLNDTRPEHLAPINLCIQINISDEPKKAGIHPDELGQMIAGCSDFPRIRIRGLMALPKPSDDFGQQRLSFRALKKLLDKINKSDRRYDTLSMGTSHDFEAAIAEGSTIVRIGTAIFGARS